jgi:acetyl esterase/lipase
VQFAEPGTQAQPKHLQKSRTLGVPGVLPASIPRTYLVVGTREPFFLTNAARWANALRDAGADVVMHERAGSHGDAFWQEEFPLMVAWAFARPGHR